MPKKKARTTILYADSGDTKTSQLYLMAKWIYQHTGKRTRLVSADGGGWGPFEDLIQLGVVEAFDFSKREFALADTQRLADGFWPRIVKERGKMVRLFRNEERCATTAEEWRGIGAVMVEGLASISSNLITHIGNQEGTIGFKRPYTIEEDGYTFGGNDKGDYGIVQNRLHQFVVQGCNRFPVDYVIYTSTVGKGEDKQKNETLYGPQGAGSAKTAEMPIWVMDCLHLGREVVGGVEKVVMWFRRHPDKHTDVDYLAKVRLQPELYPKLLKSFPEGYIPMSYDGGMGRWLDALEKFEGLSGEVGREWKERVDREREGR